MKQEIKKISKIIDELVTYFLYTWNTSLSVSIERREHAFVLDFICKNITMSDDDFVRFTKRLKVERKPELEEYYWQLSGEIEDTHELMLIAMMSDSIEIERKDNDLHIRVTRQFT